MSTNNQKNKQRRPQSGTPPKAGSAGSRQHPTQRPKVEPPVKKSHN